MARAYCREVRGAAVGAELGLIGWFCPVVG